MTPKTITEDELADALARRDGMSPDDAGRVARTLLADIEGHREPAEPSLTGAQCDRLRQMVDEHTNAVSAVRAALEYAAARISTLAGAEMIAAAGEALKTLSGEEAGGACACGQENCRG